MYCRGHERERDDHRQGGGGHRELRGGVDRARGARGPPREVHAAAPRAFTPKTARQRLRRRAAEGQGRLERRHRQHGAVGRARGVAAAPHAPRARLRRRAASGLEAVPDLRELPGSHQARPGAAPDAGDVRCGRPRRAVRRPRRRDALPDAGHGRGGGRGRADDLRDARRGVVLWRGRALLERAPRGVDPVRLLFGMPGAVAGRPAAPAAGLWLPPAAVIGRVYDDQEAERGRQCRDQPQPQGGRARGQ
mmetsp:Transcript_6012/g.17019  ORF Transcript_6012/g.17019 Transcript_6012/m.17019 type:complete len:249 (-) Transcript_6012:1815-2561(-)